MDISRKIPAVGEDESPGSTQVIQHGEIVIDLERHSVVVAGQPLSLTLTEFNVLRALAECPGQVLSRQELLARARHRSHAVLDRTIDVHVVALRRKLGMQGDLVETIRGVGYRMKK